MLTLTPTPGQRTERRRSVTSAGVRRPAVVEPWQARLAAPPTGVVQTLEAFAAAAVAASWHAGADVSVTLAGPAGSVPHRVAIETLLADVAAAA